MTKFQRYDSYKNSDVEWLGEIPSHWEILKLKFIGKIFAGLSDKKGDDFSKDFTNDKKPFVPFTNVCNNLKIDKNQMQYVKINPYEMQNKVREKDIIFLMSSETLDDIGKCSIYLEKEQIYLNSFCKGFRPNLSRINAEFLNYLLQSKTYRNYFNLAGRGFTRINIKQEYIANLCAVLPPKDEQEKIASYLDEKIAKIDAAISGKEKFIELLKEQKQIIINDATTKGLNKNAKFKNSGVEWLGEIPSHWKNIKTTHIFNRIGSGTTPTSTNTKYYDGEINWLQTGDLADDIIYKTSKKITHKALKDFSTLKIYPKNSLVIAMYGATIGKVGILDIETTTNQACCVLSDTKQILEKYAFYWFLASKNNIISLGYGGGQPNISQDLIKSLRITLPPKSEQEKIVEYIETKTAKIDKLANLEQEYIKSLKEYKASLIDSVVTGKVRIV